MSDFLTVKNKFRDFVVSKSNLVADKIFWASERFSMPEYPFIMLTELSNNEDLGSGRNQPNNETLEVTLYKEATFTVAIYGLSGIDFSEEKNNFRLELERIRNALNIVMFTHALKKDFAIKNITDLRPLNEENETGFEYRYEFDIRLGYNETISEKLEQSEGVIIDLEENNVYIEINKENLDV